MDLFVEGQKLTLYFQKNSNMVEITCVIEKVFDDRLALTLPQYFMRYVEFLQVGKKLTAKAFSKVGTIDFNTIIINSPLDDSFCIELDHNSLKLTQGTEISSIKAIEQLNIENDNSGVLVKTYELSTEYVKFTSKKKFTVKEEFNGILNLPKDYGIIKFKAVVTEIDPIYDNEFTAEFVTMTEEDRQKILYYMYMYTKETD